MNLPKCENSDVILLNTARGHLDQQMKMAPDMTFDDENDINIQNNTKEKISQRKNIFIQQRYHCNPYLTCIYIIVLFISEQLIDIHVHVQDN